MCIRIAEHATPDGIVQSTIIPISDREHRNPVEYAGLPTVFAVGTMYESRGGVIVGTADYGNAIDTAALSEKLSAQAPAYFVIPFLDTSMYYMAYFRSVARAIGVYGMPITVIAFNNLGFTGDDMVRAGWNFQLISRRSDGRFSWIGTHTRID
jgi:hypothetical protein